jgi:hypothetical protein
MEKIMYILTGIVIPTIITGCGPTITRLSGDTYQIRHVEAGWDAAAREACPGGYKVNERMQVPGSTYEMVGTITCQ